VACHFKLLLLQTSGRILGLLIVAMEQDGWTLHSPTSWTAPDGATYRLSAADHTGLQDFLQVVQGHIINKLWSKASAHRHGRGLQQANVDHLAYRQANDWRVLLVACQTITAQTYIDQGLTGFAIKAAMDQARLACINQFRAQHE
jgi:hypothetical protein